MKASARDWNLLLKNQMCLELCILCKSQKAVNVSFHRSLVVCERIMYRYDFNYFNFIRVEPSSRTNKKIYLFLSRMEQDKVYNKWEFNSKIRKSPTTLIYQFSNRRNIGSQQKLKYHSASERGLWLRHQTRIGYRRG